MIENLILVLVNLPDSDPSKSSKLPANILRYVCSSHLDFSHWLHY